MYNKKIDIFDICTISNSTINNMTTNIIETNKLPENGIIAITYPHLYSLTSDLKNDIISEEQSITNMAIMKYKKENMSEIDLLDDCLDECSDKWLDNFYDVMSEFDEENIDFATYNVINYDQHVVSETDFDTIKRTIPLNKSKSYVNFNECVKDDELEEYILTQDSTKSSLPTGHEEICKMFYERNEPILNTKSSDYSNESFCSCCKIYQTLPDFEIYNFLNKYLITNTNRNIKYLIIVFRLRPEIFSRCDIMMNKHLRKYIFSYLSINNTNPYNLILENSEEIFFKNISVLNEYFSKITGTINTYIYENLFHQPNLNFTDYVKCDSCKNYMCPMHTYLANCYFAKCRSCNVQNWSICGWCKPGFNEDFACKYLHNNKSSF